MDEDNRVLNASARGKGIRGAVETLRPLAKPGITTVQGCRRETFSNWLSTCAAGNEVPEDPANEGGVCEYDVAAIGLGGP